MAALTLCLCAPAIPQVSAQDTASPEAVCGEHGADWLEGVLRADGRFDTVLDAADTYRLQIIVSEVIGSAADGRRCLSTHTYRAGAEYFYPASAIKIVAAVAALQRLQEVGADLDTPLSIDPLTIDDPDGSGEAIEISAGVTRVTARQLVRDALTVSSNDAYNHLYDIAGSQALNRRMWTLGLDSVRVDQRFSLGFVDWQVHRWRPRVSLDLHGHDVELHSAQLDAEVPAADVPGLLVGRAYRGSGRERIDEPLDFSHRNAASLADLLRLFRALVDPDLGPDPLELELTEANRWALVDAMTEPAEPDEGESPEERDARLKPLLPGVLRVIPERERVRYVNKVGQAYGFLTDIAYIERVRSGRAFYVAVTIYVNPNDVLNDNRYAYDEVGFPFLQNLGEVLARELLVEE